MPSRFILAPWRSSRVVVMLACTVLSGGLAATAMSTPATAAATPPTLNQGCTQTAPGSDVTCTFHGIGAEQTFQVPSWVTSVDIVAVGAKGAGQDFYPNSYYLPGGSGARATRTVAVSPGQTLYVEVGSPGGAGQGWNGGGGGSGGGASDVRTLSRSLGADSLQSRLVVAGGGGGAGTSERSGDVDCATGEPGLRWVLGGPGGDAGAPGGASRACTVSWGNTQTYFGPVAGGGAGSDSAGGAVGTPGAPLYPVWPIYFKAGSFGQGGAAFLHGGGGGGWYGGGAGGSQGYRDSTLTVGGGGGGGGGGSSYAPGGTVTVDGSTDPLVSISYPPGPVVGLETAAASFRLQAGDTFPVHAYTISSDGARVAEVTNTATFSGTGLACTGSTCSGTAAGVADIQAAFGNYSTVKPDQIEITRREQVLTFTYLDPSSNSGTLELDQQARVTADSGLPITLSVDDPAVCKVSADGTAIIPVAEGNCYVTGTQAGNDAYLPAQVTRRYFVYAGYDALSWWGPTTGDVSSTLTPTLLSRRGLPVSLSVAPSTPSGVCVVFNVSVSLLKAGVCTIIMSTDTPSGPYTEPVDILVGPRAQAITFPVPANGPSGTTVALTATSTSGLPVSYAIDPATSPSGACTVSGSTLSRVSAGTCVVVASQAGNVDFNAAPPVTLSFPVGLQSQSINFPEFKFGMVRYSYAPNATASSGLPVRFQVTAAVPAGACTVSQDGLTLSYFHQGVCQITARQDGNATYDPAPPVSNTIYVFPFTQQINFQMAQDTNSVGSLDIPVASSTSQLPVSFSIAPESTPAGVCTMDGIFVLYHRAGTCVIAADQAGDADTRQADTVTRSVQVGPAATISTARITPTSVIVDVQHPDVAVPAGYPTVSMDTPTGTVALRAAGQLYQAPLVNGTATFPVALPTNQDQDVWASYLGDANNNGSQDLGRRLNPVLVSKATATVPYNAAGWYRVPVTVSFTCTPLTAPLTGACPASVTLSADTKGTTVSRTILAEDGGRGTTSRVIKIDRTAPTITIRGVVSGRTYASAPRFRSSATDATSGVVSRRNTFKITRRGGVTTVRFVVRAVDRAGNVRVRSGYYRYR